MRTLQAKTDIPVEANLIDNYLSLLSLEIAIKRGMLSFTYATIIRITCHLLRYRIYISYIQVHV